MYESQAIVRRLMVTLIDNSRTLLRNVESATGPVR